MPTFEERIESLTGVNIESASTVPTQAELSSILRESVASTVNKIIAIKPEETPKFTTTTTSETSIVRSAGPLVSVCREHDSATILRPCTPINASLRYEATDSSSLYYRSKTNPGYYELNSEIHCVPAAGSSNNEIVVTQITYDSGLLYSDNVNASAITNFPVQYEPLILLLASSTVCNLAAADIHKNLPTKPAAPTLKTMPTPPTVSIVADFVSEDVSLPSLPDYNPPAIDFDLNKVLIALNNEDIEIAEKELELVEKRVERFNSLKDNNVQVYQKELEVFKSDLENLAKNADRDIQAKVAEHKGRLEEYSANIMKYEKESTIIIQEYVQDIQKYSADIQLYSSEMQKAMTKYKWYYDNYISFLNQYNNELIGGQTPQQPQEEGGE